MRLSVGCRGFCLRVLLLGGWGCLFCCASAGAQAQSVVVNSQGVDLSDRSEDWSGQLGFSASFAAGNVQLLRLGATGKAQHQRLWEGTREGRAPWLKERWMGLASVSFGRAGGKSVENQALIHLRWTRMWWRRLGSEVFLQSRFNEFLRLRQRALFGLGLRFDYLNRDGWLGWLGSAYMLEYNLLIPNVQGDQERWSLEHRWSSYVALRKSHWDDRLLFQATVFAQPRFDAPSDLRVFATLDLVAKVSARVGFGFDAALAYDARPPAEVEKVDLRLSSTLRVKLGSV